MSSGRWVELDCPGCGFDYDIEDPADEEWANPKCPVCGAEPSGVQRYGEDGEIVPC